MNKKKMIRNWHPKMISNSMHSVIVTILMGSILILITVNNAAAAGGGNTVPNDVTNLMNNSYEANYINWTWSDPSNIDPSLLGVSVYLDGHYTTDVPGGVQYYNATNFDPNTQHTISTQTHTTRGYKTDNVLVSDIEWTAPNQETPTATATPTPTPTSTPGYSLKWSDEFNGSLDPIWEIITYPNAPWMDCDTADNIYLENGKLVLRMQPLTCPYNNGENYTTGGIRTTSSWLYGYFEIRSKWPMGRGISAAFWLTGYNWTWPPEIDVYESAGYNAKPTTDYMTYHWGTASQNYQSQGIYTGPDFSQDYHIFGMEWTPTYIRWLVDGNETYRVTGDTNMPIPNIPMQVVLNTGGGWNSLPDNSILPQYHDIDYIRIYQKTG